MRDRRISIVYASILRTVLILGRVSNERSLYRSLAASAKTAST
jgi:hypothetical protein